MRMCTDLCIYLCCLDINRYLSPLSAHICIISTCSTQCTCMDTHEGGSETCESCISRRKAFHSLQRGERQHAVPQSVAATWIAKAEEKGIRSPPSAENGNSGVPV